MIKHATVWLDHAEAKIFHVDDATFDPKKVTPRHSILRRDLTTMERERPADVQHYLHAVAKALEDAEEILVVGPGSAKLELIKHVHTHDPRARGENRRRRDGRPPHRRPAPRLRAADVSRERPDAGRGPVTLYLTRLNS